MIKANYNSTLQIKPQKCYIREAARFVAAERYQQSQLEIKMSNLKLKYGERCLSKSMNPTVLVVYEFILEHENWDSDYWEGGGGDGELINTLETYFSDFDWQDLEKDLIHWSNSQLEIFLYSIMSINGNNFEHDKIYQENPALIIERTRSVPQRANLILPILQIGIERGRFKNEIALIVTDEFFFFDNHFDILINADTKYLELMHQIMEITDSKNYLFSEYPKFKIKYEQAAGNIH